MDTALPGADLVLQALDDLRNDRVTVESLLVSIGAPRLRLSGVEVPEPLHDPEHERARLRKLFDAIEPSLYRFPAIDPAGFRRAVQDLIDRG